jgi:uncharacterized protein YaeQ
VYTHRDPVSVQRLLAGTKIHRADAIPLYAIDRAFIGEIVARLDRRMKLELSITDGTLYLVIGNETVSGTVEELRLQPD